MNEKWEEGTKKLETARNDFRVGKVTGEKGR